MFTRLPVAVKMKESSELRLYPPSVTPLKKLAGALVARTELRRVIAPLRLAMPPPNARPVLVSPSGPGAASLKARVRLIKTAEFETIIRAAPRPSPRGAVESASRGAPEPPMARLKANVELVTAT